MAEGRMLKKTIANSKKLAAVSDRAKVIWFMMLPHADVEGRVKACPLIVKGQYLTMLNYSLKAIQKALDELNNIGLIQLYAIDGNQYAEFTRYKDFQSLRTDRESESNIPPPVFGTTPGVIPDNSGELPLKLSKDKLSKDNNITIKKILDHWNLQRENGRWKTHKVLTPDIRTAIADNLKLWTEEDIKQAISNFAMVLQGKDYIWTYDRWGLREFLTRREKDDKKIPQWVRFHPNNFREDDWLTDTARQKRIEDKRSKEKKKQAAKEFLDKNKTFIMQSDPEVLIERCKRDPRMAYVVKKLRPEIKIEE